MSAVPITEEAVVELTRELVDRPTPNPPGDEADVVAYLLEYLENSPVPFEVEAVEVEPNRSNLVARAGNPDRGSLLLTGHIDTVPAEAADWTGDPYELRRADGRLVGRGTSDMKGALAASVVAAEAYLSSVADPGEVLLGFVMDEEKHGLGAQALVASGLEADAAILGEPTDMNVGVAHKGAVRYTLTVRGRNAHSGRPDRGVNALGKLWRVLERLEALDAEMRRTEHDLLTPGSSVTATEVEAGIAMNVVPAKATITVDWRTVPGMSTDPTWYDRTLADALDGLRMDGEPIEVELDRWNFARAVEVAEGPVVDAVTAAARAEGYEGTHVGFNAGTDARFLVHDGGIPTVLFGPGDIENDAHTVDESIAVDDLVGTVRTYVGALERFFESTERN